MEEYFTTERVKEIMEKEAREKVRTGRSSIGKSCAITSHSYGSIKSEIYFKNQYIGKEAQEYAEQYFKSNWWASNNKNQCPSHELGHALDNYLFSSIYTRSYRQQIKELYDEEINAIQSKMDEMAKEKGLENGLSYYKSLDRSYARDHYNNKGEKLFNLSCYGMTNCSEFIAESISAHYGGMNNPLAEKVFDLMMKAERNLTESKKEGI